MQGGSGDSCGSSNKSCVSTHAMSEVSSFPMRTTTLQQQQQQRQHEEQEHEEQEHGEEELELGLGLGLGPGAKHTKPCPWTDYRRILTAKDFPSIISSPPPPPSRPTVAGTKRAAADSDSNSPSHVVGWPPIRTYRKNSLVNQSKVTVGESIDVDKSGNEKSQEKGHGRSSYVKVNMDGIPIGRKVDLSAHVCYESLAQALEDMFHLPTSIYSMRSNGPQEDGMIMDAKKPSKLLDGSSNYVLTYEDRDGDWMLVGDVPWGVNVA